MSTENSKNEIAHLGGAEITFFVPNTEQIGRLKDLSPKFSLTTKYRNADDWAALKDKPQKCFYMGLKDVPNEDGENVNCGLFVSETEVFLSGQKVLVDAVKNLPKQTPLEITYRGKRQNRSTEGSTMIFDVSMLG